MSFSSSYGLARPAQRGMICNVCSEIADRAGLHAWLPRLVFVVAGFCHLWLAAIAYAVLAYALHRGSNATGRLRGGGPLPAAPAGPADRFGALDRRLSQVEAELMSAEADLKRKFRDLR